MTGNYKEKLIEASQNAKAPEVNRQLHTARLHESKQVSVADFNASNEAWRQKVQEEIARKLEQSQNGAAPLPS